MCGGPRSVVAVPLPSRRSATLRTADIAMVILLAVSAPLALADGATNSQWAARIEKPGLPNFHKVTDTLYRGAQPSREGMRQLKQLGVKTVVNLRAFHSDRDEIGDTGLAREHIHFNTWHAEDKEVVRFLKIVTNTNNAPVFVHCMHGADRTGMMCAIYRVAVYGWTKDQAIEEMTQGDFGFHKEWQNLILYIRELDIEKLKKPAVLPM